MTDATSSDASAVAQSEWQAMHDTAVAEYANREFKQAWKHHRAALQLAEKANLPMQVLSSRLESAATVIHLGLLSEASELLANLVDDERIDAASERRACRILSGLFELDEEPAKALEYLKRAGRLVEEASATQQFWWHQNHITLYLGLNQPEQAQAQIDLATTFLTRGVHDAVLCRGVILVRQSEIVRHLGDQDAAVPMAQRGYSSILNRQAPLISVAACIVLARHLMVTEQYEETIEVITNAEYIPIEHVLRTQGAELLFDANMKLERWREASVQLDIVIAAGEARDTNAHNVYRLQEEVEAGEELRQQNALIADANDVLTEANDDRAQLMDLVGRDLHEQLGATADAWQTLKHNTDDGQRQQLFDATDDLVSGLTSTASQVVEMRIVEARQLHLTWETLRLRSLLNTAVKSVPAADMLKIQNAVPWSARVETDAHQFVSALRHLITAFTPERQTTPNAFSRSISFEVDSNDDGASPPTLMIRGSQPDVPQRRDSDIELALGLDQQIEDSKSNHRFINLYLGQSLLRCVGFDVSISRDDHGSIVISALNNPDS